MNLLKSLGVEEDGRNFEVDRNALSRRWDEEILQLVSEAIKSTGFKAKFYHYILSIYMIYIDYIGILC